MNQFFFGSVDRPLYGVHHPPQCDQIRDAAVLVCYPLGREYMRCHRALVRLCDRLAQTGFHSMRFDYYGTGDSAGDLGEGSIDEWLTNIRSAAQELKEVSGVQKCSVVGVRIGAALATYAATKENSIETLLLWDPISDGNQYVEKMTKMHDAFVIDLDRFPEGDARDDNVSGDELVGMPFPTGLRQSIRQIDLASVTGLNAKRVAVVVTDDRPHYRQSLEHLVSLAGSGSYHVVNEPAAWDALSDLGVVMMPHELLRKIVAVLAGDAG